MEGQKGGREWGMEGENDGGREEGGDSNRF